MSNKGNLLISASGEGHKVIGAMWAICLISAIVCAVLCYYVANLYGIDHGRAALSGGAATAAMILGQSSAAIPDTKNEMYYIFMGLGIVGVVSSLWMAFVMKARIAKTTIKVYEDCIEGLSLAPKFPMAFLLTMSPTALQVSDFRLAYSEVSTVDVVDEAVLMLSAGNVQRKIYAMNAKEVRDAILSQKNKAA